MRPNLKAVNNAIARLAGMNHDAAVKILVAHGASTVKTNTSQLKPEEFQAVVNAANEELVKLGVAPTPRDPPVQMPSPAPVHEFDVEGRIVRCHESDGHRLWRCECAYFQRTLAIFDEGFCPHVAVAIGLALRDGTIDLGFAVKRRKKKAAS